MTDIVFKRSKANKHRDITANTQIGPPTSKAQAVSTSKTQAADIVWKMGMSPEAQQQTVGIDDEVVFKWEGVHNVYKMPSKAAYDACDFSEAAELASTTQSSYTYKATEARTIYFACEISDHCNSGQKLTLTVTGLFFEVISLIYLLTE